MNDLPFQSIDFNIDYLLFGHHRALLFNHTVTDTVTLNS